MVFASTTFLFIFLPVAIGVYYGLLRKNRELQNIFLACASLFFYAWGEPTFVFCMLLSIVVNWFLGVKVGKYKELDKNDCAIICVISAVIFNLTLLIIFKYLVFIGETMNELLKLNMKLPEIILPIGISFFTFQAMSYVIDVYRGHGEYQKSIVNVGLYIACFPQLIAGPIVRYETVAYEINYRKENIDDFLKGFVRFIIGLSKKVLIANILSVCADNAFNSIEQLSVAGSWLGALCYMLQIYFDFAGYSDMAIGLGLMFGFHYLENFNYPYISKSITEFWRRWHISLGTWFRDYVYIPLGGSRVNKGRLVLNLFLVWVLTGIWHGANWTFVCWGLMYFILLVFEKLTGFHKAKEFTGINVLRWIYTMFFVIIGWVIFRAESLSQALSYIKIMLGMTTQEIVNDMFWEGIKTNWCILIVGMVLSTPIIPYLRTRFHNRSVVLEMIWQLVVVMLFISSIVFIVGSSNNPFIYFNF